MIFENTNDIIINMTADYTKITPVAFSSSSSHLYIPNAPISGSPIMGEGLLWNGLPALSLAWTTNSIDFSPLGLFGKLSVSIIELYGTASYSGGPGSSPSKSGGSMTKSEKFKKKSSSQRNAVTDYFISQMYLAAEMCMDRNYVAMHKLDELYTFDTLVTILKIDVADKLKAAAARLILCLHVDRDPQAGTKVPVLTRTYSEIAKNPEPKLPYVEPQRQYLFCLLQQIMSEHVEGMADRKWNELSRRMLGLLKVMVTFNFYGTLDRMKDIIGPLVRALDRRRMLFHGDLPRGEQKGGGNIMGMLSSKSKSADELDEVQNKSSKQKPEASASSKSGKIATADGYDSSKKYAISAPGEEMKEGDEGDAEKEGEGLEMIDDEQEEVAASNKWYGMMFQFMEGIPFLMVILALVALAMTLTVLSSLDILEDTEGSPSYYVGLVIFVIFALDLILRALCYYLIHGRIRGFLTNAFNQIDFLVVAIDVIFLCLPDVGSDGSAQYTKAARLVRLVRLLRILRAARVINAFAEMVGSDKGSYREPARYTKAPTYELETMDEMVDILLYSEKVTQDRNLSMFLRAFYSWERGDDTRTPQEIWKEIVTRSQELTIAVEDFDEIFVDVLMFKHTKLMQGALDILMLRYSMQKTLLQNAAVTQLLIAPKRERQFRLIDQMLQQLERNAETHELWGELQSDADYLVNKQTKDILTELTEVCRSVSFEFDQRNKYKPEPEIQDLLRNLGFYHICLKVLELMDGIEEEDGELDEVGLNTKDLCRLCNDLMYWAILDNSKNQELAYDSLQFFMDTLDDEIGSAQCIRAVFSNNEYLMKLVPHVNLSILVDKIIAGGINGKKPQYLSLAVSITNVGDRNVVENQFEIVRTLTAPGRLQKVGSFLVPVNHREYERKIGLMADLDVNKDYSISELPEELAYHLTLLEVLAGCTAGRLNVSSIEAKIQSVFSYIDVIETILDPRMCLIAKVETTRFLLNAIIEVELVVPGLGHSKCCWRLLTSFISLLGSMKDDLLRIEAHGWEAPGVSRQKLEFQQLAIAILTIFFEKNYNVNMFTNEASNSDGQLDKVSMTITQANNIIKALYEIVRNIQKMDSPRLGAETKAFLTRCCLAMNDSVSTKLEHDEKGPNGEHRNLAKILEDENKEAKRIKEVESSQEMGQEKRIQSKYKEFLAVLQGDEEVQAESEGEVKALISTLEKLPLCCR